MENKRNKVLFIHHGGAKGGAPRSLAFLISKIDHSAYDPYVVTGLDKNGNKELFESVGAKYLYKKGIGPWHGSTVAPIRFTTIIWNVVYSAYTIIQLPGVLKEVNPDLVHINSTCMWLSAKIVKHFNKNIPVICHVREPLLPGFWGNILRKNCNRFVDHFIAIEQLDADSLNTTRPVTIINNFVDFGVYNKNIRSKCLYSELNLSDNSHILLYLARVHPVNGALRMIHALESLLKRRRDIHLCVVGIVDPKESYQKEVIDCANKIENVHVFPFRGDVPQVIASSDVMLVPFQEPHFARSIIEAGAMGVPSIGSNIGGIDELIIDGKTGYLFDYKTFDGFDSLCEKLIDDTQLRKYLGDNALALAHDRFDAEKNSKRTYAIYEKYLNEDTSK